MHTPVNTTGFVRKSNQNLSRMIQSWKAQPDIKKSQKTLIYQGFPASLRKKQGRSLRIKDTALIYSEWQDANASLYFIIVIMNVSHTIERFLHKVSFCIMAEVRDMKIKKCSPTKRRTAISDYREKLSNAGLFSRSGQKKRTNNCINHWFSIWWRWRESNSCPKIVCQGFLRV